MHTFAYLNKLILVHKGYSSIFPQIATKLSRYSMEDSKYFVENPKLGVLINGNGYGFSSSV